MISGQLAFMQRYNVASASLISYFSSLKIYWIHRCVLFGHPLPLFGCILLVSRSFGRTEFG
jgi:hypothetical protein